MYKSGMCIFLLAAATNLLALTDVTKGWQIGVYDQEKGELIRSLEDHPINKQVSFNSDDERVVRYQNAFDLSQESETTVLWLRNPLGFVSVYVNGELKIKRGDVFENGDKSARGDVFIPLPTNKKAEVDIWMENTGYNARPAGLYLTPALGHHKEVYQRINRAKYIDYFMIGLIGIVCFYHILLWMLRTENKATLTFSVFTATTVIRLFTAGDGRILLNVDGMSTTWTYYLENTMAAIGVMAVGYFPFTVLEPIKTKYIHFGSSRWLKIFLGLCTAAISLSMIPIPRVSDVGLSLMQLSVLIGMLIIVPWLVTAWIKNQDQAGLILLGFLSPAITSLIDIAAYFAEIELAIQPMGMIGFVCLQAGMLSIRFNRLFDVVDDLNENLEQKVVEKTRDIRSTLDNLPQGVFRINGTMGDLTIDEEFSAGLTDIIGIKDIAFKEPFDLIFSRTSLSESELSSLKTVLDGSLKEDLVQWEVNTHLLPKEFKLSNKIIEVDWAPICSEEMVVEKVLCVLKDVTQLRSLQELADKEAKDAVILREIARIQSYTKVDAFLSSARDYIELSKSELNSIPNVFRNLHTLKGLSLTFGFKSISDHTHEAEDLVQAARDGGDSIDKETLLEKMSLIMNDISNYQKILDELYGQDKESVSVSKHHLKDVANMVSKGDKDEAINAILFLYEHNVSKALEAEIKAAKNLALRLGKDEPEIQVLNDNFVISDHLVNTIKKSFVHLLRNSIDHGIESPQERMNAGKSSQGQITIEVGCNDQEISLVYRDDGRGLKLDTLKEKYESLFPNRNIPESAEDLVQVIFESGFSTAVEVTDISGRGVGMEAVKKFIEIEGGSIQTHVTSQEDGSIPIEFTITLPIREEVRAS